uniref:Uncharacterized protein n=1 Tax=Rhizophora mucronata TaxID=61149 RepID=A0A2P2QXW3_RHIMU
MLKCILSSILRSVLITLINNNQ